MGLEETKLLLRQELGDKNNNEKSLLINVLLD